MSPKATAARGGHGAGRGALTIAAVVVIAVVMALIVRAQPKADRLDPRSERPDGARALVLLLRDQGAIVDVVRSAPAPGATGRLLVLDDRLDDPQRVAVLKWVRSGGLAVVADPSSSMHGGSGASDAGQTITGTVPATSGDARDAAGESNVEPGECTIGALAHLRGLFVRDGVRLAPPAGAAHCFGDAAHAFAFAHRDGSGIVVGLGDNELLTNALLRFGDNAGLATALLAPVRNTTVHILVGTGARRSPAHVGTGTQTLADLVRPGVWMGLIQLGIAFVIFAIARAVRVGRSPAESRPVPLAGSELVVATGNLMQRARHSERAGWLLRSETQRTLCRRFGLDLTTSIDALDTEAVRRCGLLPGELAEALHTETTDPARLLELSNRLADLRDATLEGATP